MELQSKICVEQQKVLVKLVEESTDKNVLKLTELLGEKTILDFFTKVDLMDISLMASRFLTKALDTPSSMMETLEFKQIITQVMSIQEPMDYGEMQQQIDQIYQRMDHQIKSYKNVASTAKAIHALTHGNQNLLSDGSSAASTKVSPNPSPNNTSHTAKL